MDKEEIHKMERDFENVEAIVVLTAHGVERVQAAQDLGMVAGKIANAMSTIKALDAAWK